MSISKEFAKKRMNENGYEESLLLKGDIFKTIEIAKLEGVIEYIESQMDSLEKIPDEIFSGILLKAFLKEKEIYELKLKNILIKSNT